MFQKESKTFNFVCKGGSMRPLIRSGQSVVVKKGEKIVSGDCIAYHIEKNYYIHRVIAVKNSMYKIASDSASIKNHWIPGSFIDGKLITSNIFLKGKSGLFFFYIIHMSYLLGRCVKHKS